MYLKDYLKHGSENHVTALCYGDSRQFLFRNWSDIWCSEVTSQTNAILRWTVA